MLEHLNEHFGAFIKKLTFLIIDLDHVSWSLQILSPSSKTLDPFTAIFHSGHPVSHQLSTSRPAETPEWRVKAGQRRRVLLCWVFVLRWRVLPLSDGTFVLLILSSDTHGKNIPVVSLRTQLHVTTLFLRDITLSLSINKQIRSAEHVRNRGRFECLLNWSVWRVELHQWSFNVALTIGIFM